jgi:predicted nucleic acid-binding protein
VAQGAVEKIGPIRQELLSGIKDQAQFKTVRDRLRRFMDLAISVEDYEEAAAYYNRCRGRGIQGPATDYLLCTMAVRHDLVIFTSDRDFSEYSKVLPIRLYPFQHTG